MSDTLLLSSAALQKSSASLPLRGGRKQLANLAFGSGAARASAAVASDGFDVGRHLAFLPDETLDIDLADPAQRRFGDYELLELIGEGGMGVVYRARQVSLDREVAVKLLSAGPWASRDFIERFQSEAQNAARMQHPNIVPIHEVGAVDGLHFFSMRLVRGTSLSHLIRFGPQPTPQRAATLLRTIAEAVDYAHRLGVLHLDLKPANVLLDESGEPHVADFGLARRIDQSAAADNTEISGTPAYMSPEQATPGRSITSAADIWGLGAIGYELLTGRVPFEGDSVHAILNRVVQGELRKPREVVPLLSRDFEAIIVKCMARDPADRYRSARELADDLGRLLENRPVRARPLNRLQRTARWVRRQPYVATFAVLFVVSLLAGIVGISAQWRRAETNVDLAQRTLWESRDAASQRQIVDGEAYRALDGALANLREMEARGASAPAALERLRIGTVLANAPRLIDAIALGADIDQLEFAPDGTSIAVLTGTVIHLFDVAAGDERWSIDLGPLGGVGVVRGVAKMLMRMSQDGQRLITEFPISGSGRRNEVMIDVRKGEVVAPPSGFADLLASHYSYDGGSALLFDRHDHVQLWRVSPWASAGDLVRIGGPNSPRAGASFEDAIVSEDGEIVVGAYDRFHSLSMLDPRRLTPRRTLPLSADQGTVSGWMLSHDGRRLAAGTRTGKLLLWNTADGEVRWLQTAGASGSNVPFQGGTIVRLFFSSDDSRLLATSYQPNELRVFDARTGELVVAPIVLGQSATGGAGFGNVNRSVWLRSPTDGTRVWDLPETNVWPLSATLAAPSFPGEQTRFAMTRGPAAWLMAHADNGMMKLWRSPPPPLGDHVAAPLVADTLRVHGGALVGVAGNRLQVFDAVTQAARGVPIELDQTPTFADLTADGTTVVAITGRRLSAWDWHTGTQRWADYTLDNSPAHVSLAAEAPVIAISTSGGGSDGFGEIMHVVDLHTGSARSAPIKFRWQQVAPRLSADGKRLLAWVASDAAETEPTVLSVFDTADPDQPLKLAQKAKEGAAVGDARFADDGSIWSIISGGDDLLSHWSARGDLLSSKRLPTARNRFMGMLMPMPGGRGVIVIATGVGGAALFVGPNGEAHPLPGPAAMETLNIAALRADGRVLALAMRNGVVLVDVDNAQRLLPDLRLALPAYDSVQHLAFASDDSLVGRTVYGRWFQWQVRADRRPVADIERDLRLRHFERSVGFSAPVSAEERHRLRADDPGPAPIGKGAATASIATVPAPASSDHGNYVPLDLAPIANLDPRLVMKGWPPGLPTLPRGLQRYGGVDFHLDGGLQLAGGSQSNAFEFAYPRQSKILDVRPQAVSAVDLLAFQFDAFGGELAHVELHYADGGKRELPILQGRDILYQSDEQDNLSIPARKHVGWQGIWAVNFAPNAGFNMGEAAIWWSYVVHLENPEPQRRVAGISFGAKPDSPGMLVLAATLETGTAGEDKAE